MAIGNKASELIGAVLYRHAHGLDVPAPTFEEFINRARIHGRQVFPFNASSRFELAVDGSNPQRLTSDEALDTTPTWAPDGTKLAFVSDRGGNSEIYLVNVDGTESTNLTNDPENDVSPAR